MFSFEGDFKRTPNVSLGGASKKDERKRLKNATIIQSYIRGFQERKRQVWLCQNVVKHHAHFLMLLAGPERSTCLFQIKRLLGHCCRCQNFCTTLPLFLLCKTVIKTCVCVCVCVYMCARLLQLCKADDMNIAVPMRMLELFSLERTYLPPLQNDADAAAALTEQVLHYMVQKVFSAFTEDFVSPPFTEQMFHFFVPALTDPRLCFPFHDFLFSLQATVSSSDRAQHHAPWLFYFVLSLGETRLGSLLEEGLLLYLSSLQALLSLLPKLDSKQQTNALLSLVWRDSASEDVFTMMASICHTLMVQHRMMVPRVRLLYSLAFNARFLRHLWHMITSMRTKMITGSQVPLLQLMSCGCPMSAEDSNRIIPLFYLFSSLFSHSLLVSLSRCLRDACLGIIKLAYPKTSSGHSEEYAAAFRSVGVKTSSHMQPRIQNPQKRWVQLFKVITNLVKMLKARDIRRPFCPEGHWLSGEVNIAADKVTHLYMPSARHVWRTRRMGLIGPLQSTLDVGLEPPPLSVSEERHLAILTELPFVVPFEERVKIFQRLIYADKQDIQGDAFFLDGVNITIRRNYIYEDAYDKLSPENEPDLKKRIRVHLLNAHGLDEAGIDGGGIFREFLNELLKTAFNPNQGFFRSTNEGLLYPSPTAELLVGESFTRHYYFLGRVLGKLLGTSADVDIHHLASLDPEVYRNLLFLKSYEGDVEDLGLNFTVVNNYLGEAQVIELKPGGKDIPVTTANRIAYIHLVADYRLNKQIRAHCLAFRQGLANELYPPFCIHNAGSDPERLPTASTCMNLLKLPEFQDQQLMRSKLLYAIESSSGFELS
ncbi:Ubiquitin-protein ligase E3C [Bagarius yarrelli]|uniref:HECT-type E3 ubiquitin transferase n=1 Tax=Bagarius yarrelli TaxID=175774 RepID=A0A556VAX8_BAGYA|nr:Ubiquitin-protein ligase E3C [Bagarius yarrelli]